jgi:hypothetical protein
VSTDHITVEELKELSEIFRLGEERINAHWQQVQEILSALPLSEPMFDINQATPEQLRQLAQCTTAEQVAALEAKFSGRAPVQRTVRVRGGRK